MQGKRESTRVQIRKDGKNSDISIPYAWKESDWPDSLMGIKAAAKAHEESGQKLDLKLASKLLMQFQAKPKLTGKNQSKLIGYLRKIS